MEVPAAERPYVVEVHFEQDGGYRIVFYGFMRSNRAAVFRSIVAHSKWNVTTKLHQHTDGAWQEVERFS